MEQDNTFNPKTKENRKSEHLSRNLTPAEAAAARRASEQGVHLSKEELEQLERSEKIFAEQASGKSPVDTDRTIERADEAFNRG